MGIISKIAYVLVIIGGLNWGLIGLGDFNLVDFLFGSLGIISRTVYILVGLSAIWLAIAPFIEDHSDK